MKIDQHNTINRDRDRSSNIRCMQPPPDSAANNNNIPNANANNTNNHGGRSLSALCLYF